MTANASRPFNYGGQAVMEGVMMRGARTMAVAVRDPQGRIVIQSGPLNARIYAGPVSRVPLLRGLIMLYDALGLGMRALLWSASIAAGEPAAGQPAASQPAEAATAGETQPNELFNGPLGWGTVAFAVVAGSGLFLLLPAAIAGWIDGLLSIRDPLLSNLIEGIVRLAILVAYIAAIGQLPDVRRLFGYHGAEHKTINAYEAGAPLDPAAVRAFPIEHPRCGTAFLLTVALLSVVLFSPLPRDPLWLRFLTRLALIPVVAGVGYEILRFTARHARNRLVRILIAPNLALQRLTTREPDDTMLEVAIAALERVLAGEFVPARVPVEAGDAPLQPATPR
jgi:uncharacterized protein YqhQ